MTGVVNSSVFLLTAYSTIYNHTFKHLLYRNQKAHAIDNLETALGRIQAV